MKKNLLATVMIIMFLVGCGTAKKDTQNFIYKRWELSVLDGNQVNPPQPVYIQLTRDFTVTGFIGCNRLAGSYAIENKSNIHFDQLVTTRMACPEFEMELEQSILEMLRTVDSFSFEKRNLLLHNASKITSAVFVEINNSEIINTHWKLIKLKGKAVPMAPKQEREQYFLLGSDNSVSGFAGCNYFNGQYELPAENKIKFNDNMAMTLKICPDVDIDESILMNVFAQSDNYKISGEKLTLYKGKKPALAVFEAVYF